MVPVDFRMMMTACRLVPAPEAFVHRTTGEVLFLEKGDGAAETHFAYLADDLRALRVAANQASDWLAIPKHHGGAATLSAFVRKWCAENGFILPQQ